MYLCTHDRLCYSLSTLHFAQQPWLTPANKLWPGSGRVDEVFGDRNVAATRYDKIPEIKK